MSPEPQHSNGNGSVTFEKVRQTEQETIQAAFGKVDAWKETSHFFGVRFGYFCERHLNLPRVDRQA